MYLTIFHLLGQTIDTPPGKHATTLQSADQLFRKLLKRILRKTRNSYEVLLAHSQESFKKNGVTVQKIAEKAKTYDEQPEISHTVLSKMKSMSEVWACFEEHTSWYSSELVEALVRLYGDKDDQKNLEEFKNDRLKLVHYIGNNTDQSKTATLILKLEEDIKKFSVKRLEQVQLTLCELLETSTCPLDVQTGCVKITTLILAEVAKDTFPLSPAMKKAFRKAFPTLISIICGSIEETFEVCK